MHIGQPHCEHSSCLGRPPTPKRSCDPPCRHSPSSTSISLPMTAKPQLPARVDCGLTTKIAIGQRFDSGERFARCSALLGQGAFSGPYGSQTVPSPMTAIPRASGNGGLRPARLSASHSFPIGCLIRPLHQLDTPSGRLGIEEKALALPTCEAMRHRELRNSNKWVSTKPGQLQRVHLWPSVVCPSSPALRCCHVGRR